MESWPLREYDKLIGRNGSKMEKKTTILLERHEDEHLSDSGMNR